MKYREEHRDLFTVNEDSGKVEKEPDCFPYCYAQCISADLGMFGGIVTEFNKRWDMKNKLIQDYGDQQFHFRFHQGIVLSEKVYDNGVPTMVFNLITKMTVADRPTYKSLHSTLVILKNNMTNMKLHKLAIPKIGCGIDGLDWKIVSKDIQEVFKDTDVEILVCIK